MAVPKQSSILRSSFSRSAATLLGLMLLVATLAISPLFAQDQSSQQPTSSGAQQQPSDQNPPEAGGPQGEVSPMAIPKKKDEPPPPPKPKFKQPEGLSNYSLQVNTSLVTVPVIVTTKKGEFIPGLKKDNFKILEDGVPQQITSFQQTEAPITAVLLLEFAATHYSFMYDMLNNAYGFAQSLKPQDWVAVIAYDMHPYIVQDFTQDKSKVLGALNTLRIPGFRETNEFDALYDTLDRLERIPGRKYIILISSGVDTFSKKNFDTVLKKIKASPDVTIFPISTGFFFREMADPYLNPGDVMPGQTDRLDYLQADNEMNTFARLTGGKAYFPRFTGQVPEIVGDISNTIRNEYAIAYHPSNSKQDGTYRKIRVELVDPTTGGPIRMNVNGKPEKDYKIIAREGYTAKREVE
jgi:VWFA-related protein